MSGLVLFPTLSSGLATAVLVLLGLQALPRVIDELLGGRGSALHAVWVMVLAVTALVFALGGIVEGTEAGLAGAISSLVDLAAVAGP